MNKQKNRYNLKTTSEHRPSNSLIICIFIAVLVGGLLIGIYAYSQRFSSTGNNTASPLPSGKQTAIDNASGTEAPTSSSTGGTSNESTNPLSSAKSTSKATVEILDAYQDSSKNLVVKTAIHGISSGTCNLTLSAGADKLLKSADVLYQPEYSTCTGFVIAADELPSANTINLSLSVSAPNVEMVSTFKTVAIKN